MTTTTSTTITTTTTNTTTTSSIKQPTPGGSELWGQVLGREAAAGAAAQGRDALGGNALGGDAARRAARKDEACRRPLSRERRQTHQVEIGSAGCASGRVANNYYEWFKGGGLTAQGKAEVHKVHPTPTRTAIWATQLDMVTGREDPDVSTLPASRSSAALQGGVLAICALIPGVDDAFPHASRSCHWPWPLAPMAGACHWLA
ncbi:hypothetical protein CDD81_3802 [Ophiocordyceps australis]|uniref:Uncharacterized protein n=1 Tax=Ophiocordyceps australis TaxID=1399860 RepID=A0A2C5XRN2_9HYPO|nr:hypothetical protein CDD81_3802 [Ophiocordyceps australis]